MKVTLHIKTRSKRTAGTREESPGAPASVEPIDVELPEAPPLQVDVESKQSVVCRNCGSHRLRKKTRTSAISYLLGVFGLTHYRCRSCFHHFYSFASLDEENIWDRRAAREPGSAQTKAKIPPGAAEAKHSRKRAAGA